MSSRGTTSPFPIWRLLVLTGAIFIVVTSEFLPTGLLPDMARELKVSESQVGLLVTIFAATVVVTAVPLSSMTRRFPRKALMVVVLLIFIASNLLAAVAPNYEVLVVARVIAGATHGLFWSVTAPYASRMVPPSQLARAVSVTAAGGTAAFVLGVPFGTALGHALGWRLAFAVVGAIVLVFLILVVLFLPPVEHLVPLATGEIMVPARHDRTVPAIVIVCLSVTLIVTAQNTFSTYIVPWATQVATVPPDAVSLLLVGNGVAGAVGLLLAGWFGDTWPRASVALMIAGVAVSAAGSSGSRTGRSRPRSPAASPGASSSAGSLRSSRRGCCNPPPCACATPRRPGSRSRSTWPSAWARWWAAGCSTASASGCCRSRSWWAP
ncbi:MAG: MFS transporter [Schumannella sp.]